MKTMISLYSGLAALSVFSMMGMAVADESESTCGCQPTEYTMMLNLSLTCDDSTVSGPGFGEAACEIQSESPGGGVVPATITSIVFAEVNEDFDVLGGDPTFLIPDTPYEDGAIISFNSSLLFADEEDDEDAIPFGIVLSINGETADGEGVINNLLISYTNECDVVPELEGKQIGWVMFTDLGPVNTDFCEAATSKERPKVLRKILIFKALQAIRGRDADDNDEGDGGDD